MTHLYLIRHGQADGLKPGIAGSQPPDAGLSVLGKEQAERLRERLATGEIHADVLISSPLRRALETAETIAPALGLPVLIDDEVQELNLGECEGLSEEEIGERFGRVYMEREPFRQLGLSGDSRASFYVRIARAFDRLLREYEGKTLVIVCHGGVLDALFVYLLGLSPFKQSPLILHMSNTSITHLYRGLFSHNDKREPLWALKTFNDCSHLADL